MFIELSNLTKPDFSTLSVPSIAPKYLVDGYILIYETGKDSYVAFTRIYSNLADLAGIVLLYLSRGYNTNVISSPALTFDWRG